MIRQFIRNWLGIVDARKDPLNDDRHRQPATIFPVNYQNTVSEILMLQQKFDVLAEALGVVVVADLAKEPPEPTIASIRPDGLLGDAKEYINAVMVADKLVGLQVRAMEEQARLLKVISRK